MTPFDVILGLLTLEQNGHSVDEFFRDNDVKTVIIYGLGKVGFRVYEAIRKTSVQISCGIDRAADELQVDGLDVIKKDEIGSCEADLIVVTPMDHYWDIKYELEKITTINIISIGEIVEYCLTGEIKPRIHKGNTGINRPEIYSCITLTYPSKSLFKKNILVTGGSSGIGLAVAKKALSESAEVIITGRDDVKLQKVSKDIGCGFICDDIEKISDNEYFFSLEEKVKVKIDAVVCNAGIYEDEKLGEYTKRQVDSVIDINLKGSFMFLQAYINYCRKKRLKGNAVVTASNRGLFGDTGPYGISKAGIINAVCGFARETINEDIRINAVCPGMTASRINGLSKNSNLYTDSTRGKRVLLAEEIAEVICWLLSDNSSCISGAIIPCDRADYLR